MEQSTAEDDKKRKGELLKKADELQETIRKATEALEAAEKSGKEAPSTPVTTPQQNLNPEFTPIIHEHQIDTERVAELEKEITLLEETKTQKEEIRNASVDHEEIYKLGRDIVKIEKIIELKEIEKDREEKLFSYYTAQKVKNKFYYKTTPVDLRYKTWDGPFVKMNSLHETENGEGYFRYAVSGFIMIIKNVDELTVTETNPKTGEVTKMISSLSDRAIYKIMGPDGQIIKDDIQGYTDAHILYEEEVKKYEEEVKKEFNSKSLDEIRAELNADLIESPSIPEAEPIPAPEILPTIPQTPEAIELEKKLDEAREKYAEEYKNFLAGADKLTRAKRFVFGAKIKDSKIPPELKELEKEYEIATVAYGQKMYDEEADKLSKDPSLSEDEKKIELALYKQNKIFTIIIKEQSMLNALKAENLPPKEKGIFRKGLGWYLDPKTPRWKKLAISTVLSTAVIAGISSSTVVAAGGLATFAGMRATRAVAGSIVGQSAAKAYDWLFKEKSTAKRASEEKKLAEMFKEETFDVSLAKGKKEYAEILEREQKAKRNRLITKAMITIVAGGLTSYGMGYGLSHLSDNSPEQLQTSGVNDNHQPDIAETSQKTNVELQEARPKTEVDTRTLEDTKTATPATPANTPALKSADVTTPETIKPEDIAVIQKGEGIEHAFRRQIETDTELAKSLGFKGGVNDTKALHEFSGGAAHRVALEHGYVDKITGEEIRVKTAGEVAYRLKLENGELKVDEMKAGGGLIERNAKGSEFEKDTEEYEYKRTKPSVAKDTTISETIPSSDLKVSAEDLKAKIEAQINASESNLDAAEENANMEQLSQTLRKQGYTGDPTNRKAVDEFFKKLQDNSAESESWRTEVAGPTAEQNDFAQRHADFIGKNPSDLDMDELIQAYETRQKNIDFIFKDSPHEPSETWNGLKSEKAFKIIDQTESQNPETRNLAEYLIKIRRFTGLEPKNTFFLFGKAKSVEDYVAQGLQKIVEKGQIEEFEASLRE